MKRLFFLSAVMVAVAVHGALPTAERLLPTDTLGFVTVPDWNTAKTNFAGSALGQFVNDPSMKAFKDKLTSNFFTEKLGPLEKQLGIKFADYAELASGQMTFALTRKNWDGSLANKPGFLWLIDTRDKSGQASTNITDLRKRWVDKGNKMRIEKVRDVEFTTFIVEPDEKAAPSADGESKKPTASELMVGLSGTLVVLSDSIKDVEKVLALQSGSSIPPLADQASFAANAPMARDASAFLWVDAKSIVSAMTKQAREERQAAPPPSSLFGPAPTIDRVLASLGLNDVRTIAASVSDSPDGGIARVSINVPESGRRGLFKILAVDQKDCSPPPFVPADAVKFSRWRIDLQKAWTSIENMMNDISPASGGVIKLLLDTAGKDKDPNFDLRKVLLANLGDDVISYEKAARPGDDPASPPSLTLVGSKNADQMATSLKALTSIIPPNMAKYQEREFLGRKVCSFTWPSMTDSKSSVITYSASGGYVAISTDPSLVEEYLRSNEGKNKPLRDTPGLTEAAQKVGGMNTGFFAYENQKESMRATFEAAKKNPAEAIAIPGSKILAGGASPKETGSVTNWFDPSLLPPYERVAKYFHLAVTAVNVSPESITFKMFAATPPQLRK